ncbi:hypothetical protein MASR2M15_27010 [Anaerolineales bacterium]
MVSETASNQKSNTRTLSANTQSILIQLIVVLLGVGTSVAGGFVIGQTTYGALAVAALLGMIFVAVMIARPYWGLYILVFVTYSNMSWVATDSFGIPSINRPLVALILGVLIVSRYIIARKPIVFRRTEALLLAYGLVITISAVLGKHVETGPTEEVADLVKDFLMILIIIQLCYDEFAWKTSQWILIGTSAFLSALSWYQTITGDVTNTFWGFATFRSDSTGSTSVVDFTRSGGPIGEANFYAQSLLLVYPMALYRGLTGETNRQRIFGLMATGLIAGAIVFTYSRSALIVMTVITFLVFREARINFMKVFLVTTSIGILVMPILPAGYSQRVLSLIGVGTSESSSSMDDSAQGRLSEAIVALKMFQDYPILGIGYEVYEENYLSYSARVGLDNRYEKRQAHNFYLEALGETGVIGFAFLIALFAATFKSIRNAMNEAIYIGRADLIPWLSAMQYGLLAYLINSFFLHDDYVHYLRLGIALTLGASVMVHELVEKHRYEQQVHTESS